MRHTQTYEMSQKSRGEREKMRNQEKWRDREEKIIPNENMISETERRIIPSENMTERRKKLHKLVLWVASCNLSVTYLIWTR